MCPGDWNQDRIFLLFYKRITPVYIVEEELMSLEYSKFVERIVNEVPHLRRGKFSKLSLMKRSAHLQYPQIDREISLLVDHLLLQWFYRWWYVLGKRRKVFLGYKSDRLAYGQHECLIYILYSAFSSTERYHPPPSNVWQFASQRNQSTVITNVITDVIKRSTWIRCISVWNTNVSRIEYTPKDSKIIRI